MARSHEGMSAEYGPIRKSPCTKEHTAGSHKAMMAAVHGPAREALELSG